MNYLTLKSFLINYHLGCIFISDSSHVYMYIMKKINAI